jgi:hypothetical protein
MNGSLKQGFSTEDYPSRKSLSKSQIKKSVVYNNRKSNKTPHFMDHTESCVPTLNLKKIGEIANSQYPKLCRAQSEPKLLENSQKLNKSEPQRQSKHKAGLSISVFPNYPAKPSLQSSTIKAKSSMDNLRAIFAPTLKNFSKKTYKLRQNKTIEQTSTLPTDKEPELFIGRNQKKVPSSLTASQGQGVTDTRYSLRNSFLQSYKKYVVNSPLSTFLKK